MSSIRFQRNTEYFYFAYGAVTPYTGSGTGWTNIATTPFELANNPVTGMATLPEPAPLAALLGASPGAGNAPVLWYDDEPEPVEEVIPIQVWGTGKANAHLALRALKRFLLSSHDGQRIQLSLQPTGASVATVFEILTATIRELPLSLLGAEEARAPALIRAEIRYTRRAFGGTTSAAETIINAASLTNTTASCITSTAATRGDLTTVGQPMNLSIAPSATQARFYLASISGRATDTSGFSATSVTSTTAYTTIGTATLDVAALYADPLVTPRLLVRVSSASSTLYARVRCFLNTGSTPFQTIQQYSSIWPFTSTITLLDFGDLFIPLPPAFASTATLTVEVSALLSVAGAVNATVAGVEVLFCRQFCRIDASVTSSQTLNIVSYPDNATYTRAKLPLPTPLAGVFSGTEFLSSAAIFGSVPRAYSDGSLWVAMCTNTANAYNAAHTMTVNGYNAPLTLSLFGEA